MAAYETVANVGPSTSAAARAATKKAAPKKATPKRGARARGRGGRGRAPQNEETGDDSTNDDSVTAIDDSVTMIDDSAPAVEYTPERSEPDEIDAREFSNNVSAMFNLTCGGDGGSEDDDDDEESVYHSCEDSDEGEGAGGSAEGSTLNADQIVERMRTMFETSLMLHAKGKYMKASDSRFDIFPIWPGFKLANYPFRRARRSRLSCILTRCMHSM